MQWGAPYAAFARLETTPARRLFYWKKAAELEVRNLAYWEAYATAATEANDYKEAAKGWAGAERASPGEAERKRLIAARRDIETKRADYAESERRRASEERFREIERLKAEAEAKAAVAAEAEAKAAEKAAEEAEQEAKFAEAAAAHEEPKAE